MNYCLCRVIGNELPPKDCDGCKIESLKFVLEMDKKIEASKIWLINRVLNPNYRREVRRILGHAEIMEIPFEANEYVASDDKTHYLTNINPARNALIKRALSKNDFAVSLDQDCFFSLDLWLGVMSRISSDPLNRSFYGLVSKRTTLETVSNYDSVPDGESMLIFRKNAPFMFDESLVFGQNDKVSLLEKLGYEGLSIVRGDECMIAGNILHIGYDSKIETDLGMRMDLRRQGLNNLREKAERRIKVF
jgi:hypothetical protein